MIDWADVVGGIMIIFFISVMAFVFVIAPFTLQGEVETFCKDNNYSEGIYGQTIFSKSYCIKYEDNYKIKQEIESCGNNWCFIK